LVLEVHAVLRHRHDAAVALALPALPARAQQRAHLDLLLNQAIGGGVQIRGMSIKNVSVLIDMVISIANVSILLLRSSSSSVVVFYMPLPHLDLLLHQAGGRGSR